MPVVPIGTCPRPPIKVLEGGFAQQGCIGQRIDKAGSYTFVYWIDLIQHNLRGPSLLYPHPADTSRFRGAQNMVWNAWHGALDHIANFNASVFSGASCAIPPIGGSV